jgi:hypothetical protein
MIKILWIFLGFKIYCVNSSCNRLLIFIYAAAISFYLKKRNRFKVTQFYYECCDILEVVILR